MFGSNLFFWKLNLALKTLLKKKNMHHFHNEDAVMDNRINKLIFIELNSYLSKI